MSERALKPGWRRVPFEEIAVNVTDRVEDPASAGVDRYVGLEHLDSDSLRIRRWGAPTDVNATKLRFRKGDIIFGRRRAYQRKLGLADFDGICSAHAMVLRAKPDNILPEFLPFFMQSNLFMNRAQEISVGSLSPTINWKALASEVFLLPPLSEQASLCRAMKAASDVREELGRCLVLLDATTRAFARHAAGGTSAGSSPGQPPGTYATARDGLFKLQTGPFGTKLRTEYFVASGVPVLTIGSLTDEGIDDSALFYLSPDRAREFGQYSVVAGDIVFSRVADVGRCLLVNQKYANSIISSNLIRMQVDQERILPEFFMLQLKYSESVRRQIRRLTNQAAGRLLVNTATMSRLQFWVPAFDWQSRVVEQYSELLSARTSLVGRAASAESMSVCLREHLLAI